MYLKALDTIRISSAGRGTLRADDEFEVSDHEGKLLVDRGLAVEVKSKAKPDSEAAEKAAPAPQNKAAPLPANKAKK